MERPPGDGPTSRLNVPRGDRGGRPGRGDRPTRVATASPGSREPGGPPALPDLGLLIAVLLLAQLILLIAELQQVHGNVVIITNDARRYHEIATTPGLAYRDFPVEFPPLSYFAIRLLNGSDVASTAVRLGCFSFVLQLVITFALWKGWSARAAYGYLFLTVPLAVFLFFRIDLLSVALAVGGLALAVRGKERAGGVVLAAGVLAKGWPILLLIPLALKRRMRAVRWGGGATALAVIAWVAVTGPGAPVDVITFRHAHGWQIYSTPGILVILLTGANPVMDAGATRVGSATPWAQALLVGALAAYVGALWWRHRRADPDEGVMATGIIAALLFVAPIVSEQYVSWLLPWIGIAAARGRTDLEWLGRTVAVLTVVVLYPTFLGPPVVSELLVLGRNVLLAALAARVLSAAPRGVPIPVSQTTSLR